MTKSLRTPSLETIGLGSTLEVFQRGALPATASDLVDRVFGPAGERGALVISGANGIVGAGKTMQLGSRLHRYGVPIVALDLPGAPDGIGRQYRGLVAAFGRKGADEIMAGISRMSYDGTSLPDRLADYRPRFLLEAIPEILELKRAHYDVFRRSFPDIEIRSVTSGFPSSELGVGIAHPAFPHEINKVYEIVEPEPSAVTQLLWALGLIPVPVSDNWSFVLDVLFCGLTLSALRFHGASNMPYWKIDKFTRRLLGPNPLRAHDAIGAKGANFLTWSCLHHLADHYGDVFAPTGDLTERKDTGQNWYPPNHFRPLVNWSLDGDGEAEFDTWILGPLFQMASLMVHENRGELSHINIIGELCAQFRSGILAQLRRYGADRAVGIVKRYHALHPAAAANAWHPEAFERLGDADWQQLYVNAEHDGDVGAITIGRESYNRDVDAELNRAIDWLKSEGIERVVVGGDFHLTTQLVGADTSEFYPAVEKTDKGLEISRAWSRTARRLEEDFRVSVGFVGGKRCLGGMLELLSHCHYVVAVEDAQLGFPEVTLPVVPGMEGCHWTFRKSAPEHWPKLLKILLEGTSVRASDALGWLVDVAAPLEPALKAASALLARDDAGIPRRKLEAGALEDIPSAVPDLASGDAPTEAARRAIALSVSASCGTQLSDALEVQARHSAEFMTSESCRRGVVGTEATKTMKV
jgi:enoyl-CoA hydratase/carnithine racemase/3-hydroxyacyl-CoA dehydrogenase